MAVTPPPHPDELPPPRDEEFWHDKVDESGCLGFVVCGVSIIAVVCILMLAKALT